MKNFCPTCCVHWNPVSGPHAKIQQIIPSLDGGGDLCAVCSTPLVEFKNHGHGSKKLHCANCANCKRFLMPDPRIKIRGEIRIKCAKGNWGTFGSGSRMFSSLPLRIVDHCPDYDSMGENDKAEFLEDLFSALPTERQFRAVEVR